MRQVKVFALAKKDVVGTQDVRAGVTVRYVVECSSHQAESTFTGTIGGRELVPYETVVKSVKIEEVLRENFTHWYVAIDEESEARLAGRPRVDEHTLRVIRQEVAKGIEAEKKVRGLDTFLNVLDIKGPSTIKTTISEVLLSRGDSYSFDKHGCGWREGTLLLADFLKNDTQTYTAPLTGEEGTPYTTIVIYISPSTLTGVVELEIGQICHHIEDVEFNSNPIRRLNDWERAEEGK